MPNLVADNYQVARGRNDYPERHNNFVNAVAAVVNLVALGTFNMRGFHDPVSGDPASPVAGDLWIASAAGSGVTGITLEEGDTFGYTGTAFAIIIRASAAVSIQSSVTDTTAGAAMIVGAFGLGGDAIEETTDADSLSVSGLYNATAVAANIPTTEGYKIINLVRSNGEITQIATVNSAEARTYIRNKVAGVWTGWKSLADGVDIAPSNIPGKNRFVNGSFDVWQRGTSFSSEGVVQYSADRWCFYRNSLVAGGTVSRQPGTSSRYALRVARDSGNAAVDALVLGQIIETANCADLGGKTITVSFKAKAGANFSGASSQLTVVLNTGSGEDEGNLSAVAVWASAAPQNSVVTITSSLDDYSATFTIPSGTKEIALRFVHNPVGTAGAADYFELENVQFEVGEKATEFERLSYGQVLQLCQRYYARIKSVYFRAYQNNGSNAGLTISLPEEMRVAPTLTKVGTWTVSTAGQPSTINPSTTGFGLFALWGATGDGFFVADNPSTMYVEASAEL